MDPCNYNNFLSSLKRIHNPKLMKWEGNLFLPPCNCSSPLTPSLQKDQQIICKEAVSSKTVFDYNSKRDINCDTFIDLCSYVNNKSSSRSQIGYWLCNKYSLPISSMDSELSNLASQNNKKFRMSTAFQTSVDLLLCNDLNILSPFNKCKLTLEFNSFSKNHIKYLVKCSHGTVYKAPNHCRDHQPSLKPRKTDTFKTTSTNHRCGFYVNLFFDLRSFRWFIKVANNNIHTFHHPTSFDDFKFDQRHITPSMKKEVYKLNNGNTSTTTQANILTENNHAVLSRQVLYNTKKASLEEELNEMTDCEKLLDKL